MKTKLSIIIVGFVIPAFAVLIVPFPGWDNVKQNSKDILIVKCNKSSDSRIGETNGIVEMWGDGILQSDINVVSVLKGTNEVSQSQLLSSYSLRENNYYLIFCRNHDDHYNAIEEYRVVSLGNYFSTNSITGKPLDEQIQTLFQQRVNYLNRQMKLDQEEKERLEQALK